MALEVGKVRRLRGMVASAIPSEKLDGTHAPALTSTYAALRQQIADSLDSPLQEEFADFFPELPVIAPPSGNTRDIGLFPMRYASAAHGAATKIRLMEGWLDALISEHQTARDESP